MWNIPLFQSISSYNLLLSKDEILTKAEIHLWDVKCQIVFFCYLHTEKHRYANITLSQNACKHTRQKTGMIACANSLLCTRTNKETTHSASVSYVERQTFDFGGTHLFAQPIKWQWGASLAGNNSNEPLSKCHASNIPCQKKLLKSFHFYLSHAFKTILFCHIWKCHLTYTFKEVEQLSLCL